MSDENTDYDCGYFQGVRDSFMIFALLGSFNAKDVQLETRKIIDDLNQKLNEKRKSYFNDYVGDEDE